MHNRKVDFQDLPNWMNMIGCYATGIMPRPKELIEKTRGYVRGRTNEEELEQAFEQAESKVVNAQSSHRLSYLTDGMLKWPDLLRPSTSLEGIRIGSLARWFNNNTFYRKPSIIGEIRGKMKDMTEIVHTRNLPSHIPRKAILPAPYTFAQLSENRFYKNKVELMYRYAEILKDEIASLAKIGVRYVQLSDPALVYQPDSSNFERYEADEVRRALEVAVEDVPVRTCLQTFFGNFSRILPEALDFPVDDLGIDLYETGFGELKEYNFEKGVALGAVDSRNSLVEKPDELVQVAEEIIESIYPFAMKDVFICPNCDLEFLPWERAEEKLRVISIVADHLRDEFC